MNIEARCNMLARAAFAESAVAHDTAALESWRMLAGTSIRTQVASHLAAAQGYANDIIELRRMRGTEGY